MSLSDPADTSADAEGGVRWGTIFMGPDESRESRMDKVLNLQERELWNRSTENDYMLRVRAQATLRAQALFDKAQANAASIRAATLEWAENVRVKSEAILRDAEHIRAEAETLRAEAEHLRECAGQEGYQAGIAAAQAELEAGSEVRGAAAAAVIERMRAQCGVLFDAWRDELAGLTCDAVAAATGWVLDAERGRIVTQVLCDAARTLEGRQRVSLHVHPDDVPFFEDVLGTVRERLGAESWNIQPDAEIESGGMRLESDFGRVEAYPSTRRAIVDEALSRLELPPSAADEAAQAAVNAPYPELDLLPPPLDLADLMGVSSAEDAEDAGADAGDDAEGTREPDTGATLDADGMVVVDDAEQEPQTGEQEVVLPTVVPALVEDLETAPQLLSGLSEVIPQAFADAADFVSGVAPDLLSSLAPREELPSLMFADSFADPAAASTEFSSEASPAGLAEALAAAGGPAPEQADAPEMSIPERSDELALLSASDAVFTTLEANATTMDDVDAVIDLDLSQPLVRAPAPPNSDAGGDAEGDADGGHHA